MDPKSGEGAILADSDAFSCRIDLILFAQGTREAGRMMDGLRAFRAFQANLERLGMDHADYPSVGTGHVGFSQRCNPRELAKSLLPGRLSFSHGTLAHG